MEVYYDTNKMRECGKDINNLIDNLSNNYDELFERIENMNKTTSEWVGNSAERYIQVANNEKKEYVDYINDLRMYANHLITYADIIDQKIGTIRR